jgi:uncharacterized phage protein (TIGR01671 family)
MGIGGVMIEDRFKIRFYDKDKKIMIDENSDTKYIANIYGRDEWYWCIEAQMPKILSYFDGEGFVEGKWHKFNFAIMQCTGLKDKNGKLIYEGDILGGIYHGYIEYCNECKCLQLKVKDYGCLACEGDLHWYELVEAEEQNELEVIGNIYENPELLED